jgi:hypothetical protein
MRFMAILKAYATTEAGVLPDQQLRADMGWVKRCPNPLPGEADIEIRQVFEAADFGEAFTPELRQAEARLGAQMAENARQ